MFRLIDSHSHLDVDAFDADRDQVLERAINVGVTRQIVPAIARSGWVHLAELCRQHVGLHPAYGLHPLYLDEHRPEHLHELASILANERPVAAGECGLDLFVPGLGRDAQMEYFMAQLKLAREFELPVIIHARRAFDEVAACIRKVGKLHGVVHSFSGSEQQARQLWNLGFSIGIGGPITYLRARRLREIVASMPIEYLLLETDSPDQPLSGHQGQRNEPALLTEVLATVAELRGESEAHIAELTCANTERLFKLN